MSHDPSDIQLSKDLRENAHRTLRLMCAIFKVDEAPLLGQLANVKNAGDLTEVFTQVDSESYYDEWTFSMSIGATQDKDGELVAEQITIMVGSPEGGIAFNVEQRGDWLMVYAGTFGVSNNANMGCQIGPDIAQELAFMPYGAKELLYNALNAFPVPVIGDAALIVESIIGILDYQPVEKFHLERTVASNIVTALDIIDMVRNVPSDTDDSFARMWNEYSILIADGPRGEFLCETLREVDDALEVEFAFEDMSSLITEATFSYPLGDGRYIEICVDEVGISFDMGFALFFFGKDAIFEPRDAGAFFRGGDVALRDTCLRVLDGIAALTDGTLEVERRRARRVIGSMMVPLAA